MTRCKYIFLLLAFCLAGCAVARTTGKVAVGVGKAGWGATKVATKTAYQTVKVTNKAVRNAVYMAKGKQIIPVSKSGNNLYVHARINRKTNAKLLIDTGASSTQISYALAKKLKINLARGEKTIVQIANGQMVGATEVLVNEISLQNVRVNNVEVIVLDNESGKDYDGLLGMSFLNHFTFQIDSDKSELILQQKAN